MEQTNWYAIYTAFRAEKRVKERLDQAGIMNYIPLRVVKLVLGGQEKQVEVPLFSGCVFVRVTRSEFSKVLCIAGVISFLWEGEIPVVYSDQQVESLRLLNDRAVDIDMVEDNIRGYSPVRVVRGELSGLEGELIDDQEVCRILVWVPRMGNVIAVISKDSVVSL
ncbi:MULTISPECIES: UpxY family transcription antiterminator [Butyricimonas]|uniref:UpxY family transcription antiterminator n=1 Tax=Butyricimonas TaxID=574697 RepID=UPI0007FB2656|nr:MULTISPECIES: UpxY family transcription antiterminator [Butyricimonas]